MDKLQLYSVGSNEWQWTDYWAWFMENYVTWNIG